MDRYLALLKDETVLRKSCQKYYQKFPPEEYTYDNLLEYQEKHPEQFKNKYTFEQLQKSRKKRVKIRKLLTQDIIEPFMKELFNRFNIIKQEDLFFYIENAGYPQSIKQLLKKRRFVSPKILKKEMKIIHTILNKS